MQLLNVNTEIRFATASGRAQVALENGLVAGVNQLVCLKEYKTVNSVSFFFKQKGVKYTLRLLDCVKRA